MTRRELPLVLLTGMMGARAVRAQQKAMPVIGWLSGVSPGPYAPFVTAFRQGLSEADYIEGQNLITIGCPLWPPTLLGAMLM
jgi:putative ABC transport system substrate-binding protein